MPTMSKLGAKEINGQLPATGPRVGADRGDPQTRSISLSIESPLTGVWECTPGSWTVEDRPDTESFYVVAGQAVITDDETGEAKEIAAGDFVVLPRGWSGRWDIVETLRKVYVSF